MFYFLASQEDVDCKPFTVHWMGQLSLVPRHPGNPCTVDGHTAFPAANRKWCHCFSVQVNSRFLTVPVLQAASYCLMTYCVLLKRKVIKKHIAHAKWGSRNGTEVCVILANSACCHTFCKPLWSRHAFLASDYFLESHDCTTSASF